MAWGQIAAAMAPTVIGMLMPRPNMPSGLAGVERPDRAKYLQMLLDTGFNPQGELYSIAGSQVAEQVKRQMAQLGLSGSSIALNNMNSSMAQLANEFLKSETDRRNKVLSTVLGDDMGWGQIQSGVSQFNAGGSMNSYDRQNQNNMSLINGLGTAMSTGIGAYQQDQERQRIEADRKQQQDNFNRVFAQMYPQPQQGVPYQGNK